MKHTKIKCRRCDGKGEVELDVLLAGTLHLLKEFKSATAMDFFENHNTLGSTITITAWNKRLERLRAAGVVKRRKEVRGWRYFPA